MEAKYIAKSISLDNRIECQGKTPPFITLKDHKENFRTSHPCHLINLCKSELGKVSKNILKKANYALIHSFLSKPVEKHRQCNHVVQFHRRKNKIYIHTTRYNGILSIDIRKHTRHGNWFRTSA